MARLRLPETPGWLTIAPDGEETGQGVAFELSDRAAKAGWVVTNLSPPTGGDFNDLLRARVMA
jgi:hypothetical protein